MNRKFYVDIKNGLNLENSITSKSVQTLIKIVQTEIILFLPNYSLQLETLGAYKIVILRSTPKIRLIESEIVNSFFKWSQS